MQSIRKSLRYNDDLNNRLMLRASGWLFCAITVMSLLAASGPASAQKCPGVAITIIVPFPPGGGADTLARIIAPPLAEIEGAQIVVDNRSGAAGNIGTELAARAAPNGCTLLLGHSSPLIVNASLYKNLPYNAEKDFAPILLMGSSQYLLVAHPSVPARSVRELVDWIKKTGPGKVSYASAGRGSPNYLSGEVFKTMAGVDITHVPFKGGGPAIISVLSGEVPLLFADISASVPQIKAGKLVGFAVTGPVRAREVPGIATMQESGFGGFDVRAWMGIFAPAVTPKATLDRLNRSLVKIRSTPFVQEALHKTGMEPSDMTTQEEFRAYVKEQGRYWSKALNDAGIKPE